MAANTQCRYQFNPASEDEMNAVSALRALPQYTKLLKDFSHSVLAIQSQRCDRMLLRFLRCAENDTMKAFTLFRNMLIWRDEFNTDSALFWKFPQRDEIQRLYPHAYHKCDKLGRPIYIERIGNLQVNELLSKVDVELMMKMHVQRSEYLTSVLFDNINKDKTVRIDKQLTVLDLNGLGRQHMSRTVYRFVSELSRIDQDFYPEVLGKMLIINAPWLFTIMWKVIRPCLHERTTLKIEVIAGDPTQALLELIDADNLPTFLGGNDETFLHSEFENVLEACSMGVRPSVVDRRIEQCGFDPTKYWETRLQ